MMFRERDNGVRFGGEGRGGMIKKTQQYIIFWKITSMKWGDFFYIIFLFFFSVLQLPNFQSFVLSVLVATH